MPSIAQNNITTQCFSVNTNSPHIYEQTLNRALVIVRYNEPLSRVIDFSRESSFSHVFVHPKSSLLDKFTHRMN